MTILSFKLTGSSPLPIITGKESQPQFTRLGGVLSDVVLSGVAAPQVTVLSPFLFTL